MTYAALELLGSMRHVLRDDDNDDDGDVTKVSSKAVQHLQLEMSFCSTDVLPCHRQKIDEESLKELEEQVLLLLFFLLLFLLHNLDFVSDKVLTQRFLGRQCYSIGGLLPSLCLSVCLPRCVLWQTVQDRPMGGLSNGPIPDLPRSL